MHSFRFVQPYSMTPQVLCSHLIVSFALLVAAHGVAQAGCSYTGFCGTIAFLGQTADRTQAVFLSQTIQAGSYIVQPTEGLTINVDAWTTTGPAQRISVSPRAATWGGTHILYSVNGGQAFVDSATQNPNGQIFPNNYRSPDSIPAATVTHVVVDSTSVVTETTHNPALPAIATTPSEHVVEVQEIKPPPRVPKPPLPAVIAGPGKTVYYSPAHTTVVGQPTLTVDKQNNPGMVVAPPGQQTIVQATTPPPIAVPPLPTVTVEPAKPVLVPQAHVTVVGQPTLTVDKQNNAGVVVAPPGQQTILQATTPMPIAVPPLPTVTVEPAKPVLVPQAHVTVVGQPTLTVDKQNNPGMVVAPPGQQTIVQATTLPPMPMVNQASYALWFDTRQQTVDDLRYGINQHSRRQISTLGFERLERDRLGWGIALGHELEKGHILSDFIRFESRFTSLNPYLSYRFDPNWVAILGAGYKREETVAQLSTLKGAYVADHYSVLVGAQGRIDLGKHWFAPSVFYTQGQIHSKEGNIQGVIAGTAVDVLTEASRQNSKALSSALEWGQRFMPANGPRFSVQAKAAVHYDLMPNADKAWSGDVRAGARVHLEKMTTLELGFARLGLGQTGLTMDEWRLALIHGF